MFIGDFREFDFLSLSHLSHHNFEVDRPRHQTSSRAAREVPLLERGDQLKDPGDNQSGRKDRDGRMPP
jgi:hypothetical protein